MAEAAAAPAGPAVRLIRLANSMGPSALGCAGRWGRADNPFTRYMAARSFGIYLFHYVPMAWLALLLETRFALPPGLKYVLLFVLSLAAALVLTEAVRRIPALNRLFSLKR